MVLSEVFYPRWQVFVDGVVEGGTAYLAEPYAHKPDFRGEPLWQQASLDALCRATDPEGLQIHVHAIGDAAVGMTLDALAHARQHNGSPLPACLTAYPS